MLHLIVPTYFALVFSAEIAAGLVTELQANAIPPATADSEIVSNEPSESLPSVDVEEELVVAPSPSVPLATTSQEPSEATEDVAAQSNIRIVPDTEWGRYVQPARSALSAARTARGRFTQINADNTVSAGSFALRRPGRMRFDYDAPSPILIVADGATVAISDSNLETVDRVPISTTPLNILLDEHIAFSKDVEVLQILERPDSIAITVRDLTGEMDGRLTLIFAQDDYALMGWVAIDTEGQIVQVSLENTETNIGINPVLFRLDDPADEEDER